VTENLHSLLVVSSYRLPKNVSEVYSSRPMHERDICTFVMDDVGEQQNSFVVGGSSCAMETTSYCIRFSRIYTGHAAILF
jgi:hypothetical protein